MKSPDEWVYGLETFSFILNIYFILFTYVLYFKNVKVKQCTYQ